MRIYTDPACIDHEVPEGHPERSERLQALMRFFEASGISKDHPLRTPQPAPTNAILRAHPQAYIDFLGSLNSSLSETLANERLLPVDPDTWMGPHSLMAAYAAAGAVCEGVDALLSGTTQRVFCAVRPPGHHAEQASAMGFCLFNSIAIGALQALSHTDIERVAILDFDVHHGNGTAGLSLKISTVPLPW